MGLLLWCVPQAAANQKEMHGRKCAACRGGACQGFHWLRGQKPNLAPSRKLSLAGPSLKAKLGFTPPVKTNTHKITVTACKKVTFLYWQCVRGGWCKEISSYHPKTKELCVLWRTGDLSGVYPAPSPFLSDHKQPVPPCPPRRDCLCLLTDYTKRLATFFVLPENDLTNVWPHQSGSCSLQTASPFSQLEAQRT